MADYPPGPHDPYAKPQAPPYGQPPYGQPSPYGQYGGYGQVSPYGSPEAFLGLPEGVVIAPQGRRVGAFFLAIPLAIVTLGIGYFIWGAIVWGKGTSPALQVLGMKAWKEDRRARAEWGDMALRNVVDYLISGISCGISSIVSFVLFLSDEPRHRTLADRIGGTVIVHDPHGRLG